MQTTTQLAAVMAGAAIGFLFASGVKRLFNLI